jgi:DNA sulfur modification protein DndD
MLIDQIELTNFRVYHGVNELNLSTDALSSITIVAGNNGFGKTSLLTSLVWCLYGKLMSEVDNKYRQEIYESGGYLKYCEKLMNRLAVNANSMDDINYDADTFSVKIKFSGIMLPSVVCDAVEVRRTYNIKNNKEQIQILIDGKTNELTKEVGPEIFINDFILPKEIAKFFFFDAEKIVSLAEIKQADEKRFLSQAYAEVLGIKKYTDLKANLTNLRLRLREKSAQKTDRDKLDKYRKQINQNDKLLDIYKQQLEEYKEAIASKKTSSDKYQEKLIREGSMLTLEELKVLRERQHQTNFELQKVKIKFNELLELAPFAIAANKLTQIKLQLEHELNNSPISASLLESKFSQIEDIIINQQIHKLLPQSNLTELMNAIRESLVPKSDLSAKVLLDFSPELQNKFSAIYYNLKNAYSKAFKQIVADQKRLSSIFNMLQRKLQDAESKERDPVINAARAAKTKIDNEIIALNELISNLHTKEFALNHENQSINRQISELTKKVKIEDVDVNKDVEAARIISKLDAFINQLKNKKKESLEKNLLRELNRLMHKDFVHQVKVNVDGELIDIELFDQQFRKIDKELLSKGEQQLYATALLKALIDESHIRFPVFIDSPLQKFDKQHSKNIIKEFYPNIAGQVILFPLLQKELSETEYSWLLPKVGNAYLINQVSKYQSGFESVAIEELFNAYVAKPYV